MNRRTFLKHNLLLPLLVLPQQTESIVAFGDSITEGYTKGGNVTSWAHFLALWRGWQYASYAVGGSLVANQRNKIESWTGTASVICWMTGYNDMRKGTELDTFRADLRAGLVLLQGRGTILLANCLRMADYSYGAPVYNHGSDQAVIAFNDVIADEAHRVNALLVDACAVYRPEDPYIAADGVHPSALGHEIIAEAALRVWSPYKIALPIVLTSPTA